MNTLHRLIHLLPAVLLLTSVTACQDDEIPVPQPAAEQETLLPDAWHDQRRIQPYPKTSNEIVLNPPPFLVPKSMKEREEMLQVALSRDASFPDDATTLSKPTHWYLYNPHRSLETGTWYWRFRIADEAGNPKGEWSETYAFEITPQTPVFVTPTADIFLKNLPTGHPRLYCFMDADADIARPNVAQHEEYSKLLSRASTALNYDWEALSDPYDWDTTDQTKAMVHNLYQAAYLLTDNPTYREKLASILRLMLSRLPVSDAVLFRSNFASTNIAVIYAECYDGAYSLLTADERARAEELMHRIVSFYYPVHLGNEENHIFDNHFWQHNCRILLQCALLLHDHPTYGSLCREVLEYYYELWTGRAPNGGFNLSGHWINGVGYFNTNVQTLWYMPLLFGHLTGGDFTAHPWYRNAGRALVYSWPPHSASAGFGDGGESDETPNRQRVAFADFLARENGDTYAAWYANECADAREADIIMRFYRMASQKTYAGEELPANAPKLLWHKDIGEVDIHSDLDGDDNLTLSFRSGPYGTTSHMTGNQNSFNLLFRGAYIYRNGGYYVGAGNQAYNLLCYRHSRGHNTLLVNGIGQSSVQSAYGQVLRAVGGDHMAYCLGDASMAYRDTTTEERWVEAFQSVGLSQTAEYGFGPTPLTKYRRHILVLYPRTVIIYDDLAASEPATWQWLLHSPSRFTIDTANGHYAWSSRNSDLNFRTVTRQFTDQHPTLYQTDQTMVPITATPDPDYPPLWHFTAEYPAVAAHRILTIIQVVDKDEQPYDIARTDNTFRIGPHTVRAQMDAAQPAELVANTENSSAVFSYSAENPVINGSVYQRRQPYSALLYDVTDGRYGVTEQMDYVPVDTRTAVR